MDIAEFLLARFAEDEAAARAATPSPWVPGSQGWDDANGRGFIVAPYHDLDISDEDAEHVTRWQPARVLAECEAKRRIVEEHALYGEGEFWGKEDALDDRNLACRRCGYPDEYAVGWPCLTLRLLAQPHADHPDYQPEWSALTSA